MKKVFGLVLVFLMSFSILASANLEDLNRYGIMQGDPDGAMRLEEEVTRAEMVKMVLSAQNLGDYAKTQVNTVFEDVSSAYWASGYIQAAWQQGIIHGKSATHFAPEDHVTNEEAVKMLVILLGYDQVAERNGGYPYGYMKTADELGLLAGLNLTGTKNALRGDIAALFSNALDIPLMKQTGFGADVTFQIMNGEGGTTLQTLRTNFEPSVQQTELIPVGDPEGLNSPLYTGRVLQITELGKEGNNYFFRNGLNAEDTALYIIDENTQIYKSVNTVGLDEIQNKQYAQVWYRTDARDEIHLTKVELMKKKPAGI